MYYLRTISCVHCILLINELKCKFIADPDRLPLFLVKDLQNRWPNRREKLYTNFFFSDFAKLFEISFRNDINISTCYIFSPYQHGFMPKRSIITNYLHAHKFLRNWTIDIMLFTQILPRPVIISTLIIPAKT